MAQAHMAQPCHAVLPAPSPDTALTGSATALAQVPASLSAGWRPAEEPGLPRVFTGGWVGYCGYETVRYGYLGGVPHPDRHPSTSIFLPSASFARLSPAG